MWPLYTSVIGCLNMTLPLFQVTKSIHIVQQSLSKISDNLLTFNKTHLTMVINVKYLTFEEKIQTYNDIFDFSKSGFD